MSTRFPAVSTKLGFGVGLDMPWGSAIGFAISPDQEPRPSPRVERFLKRHRDDFDYSFASFQPRSRNVLRVGDYLPALERFFEHAKGPRALHHTILNTGSPDAYEKRDIIRFTNELVAALELKWINEDLGIWSHRGKPLPYPLPPLLTREGLEACVEHVREYQEQLAAPLLIEFPGFTEGASFMIGDFHGYDYFREVVERTKSPCTLDTGHLIGYRWVRGKRGDELYSELERLPLESCFEIHLSGCQIVSGRFVDFHHGIVMDEQLELLDRLLELCPNVKAVTYEDPKFGEDGVLIEKARLGFERLKERVRRWKVAA